MVPSKIVRWWLRTAEPPNRRIAEAPNRRVAETPDRRIAETLDLRITGHLSRRTYEAPKVVRRAPEVVRPIVDVGSEKGLRRLVATRRYWDAYGGTGRDVGASGGMRTGGTGCLQALWRPDTAYDRKKIMRSCVSRTSGFPSSGATHTGLGYLPELQIDLRGFKSPKRRNSERRNAEIPYTKCRSSETPKRQNFKTPRRQNLRSSKGRQALKLRKLGGCVRTCFGGLEGGMPVPPLLSSAVDPEGSWSKAEGRGFERSAKDFGGSSAVGTNLRNSEDQSAKTPNTEAPKFRMPKRKNSGHRNAGTPDIKWQNSETSRYEPPKLRETEAAKLRGAGSDERGISGGSCYGSERRNLRNRRNLRDTEAPKLSKTPKISEAIRDVPEALVTSGGTAEVNDQPPAEVRDRPRTCHKGSRELGIDRIGREGAMAGSVGGSGGKGNGGAFEARPGNHWTSGGAGSARPGQGKKGNENEMAHGAKGWPAEGMGGGVGKGGGERTATCRTLFSRDPRAHPPASPRRPLHLEHTGRLHGAQSKPGSGRGAEPAGGDLVLLRLGRGESLELATTRRRVSTHLGRGESLENEKPPERRSAEGFGGCPAVAVNLRIAEIAEGNRRTPRSPKLRAQRSRDSETGQKHRETLSWARGSGGGSVVAANLRTSEPPNRRTAGGPSAHDPEYANLANSSPERGQQPGEEVNLGGVRRKGLYVLSLPADWPVWPQIVRWWLRTAEPPNRRIAEAPNRRVAETPDRRIAETLDLRITGHLSRRTYEAPKVVRRAPEVVRPIVDVGSEKGLRRLVATRRYWDAYGGTGRDVGASGGMRTGGTGCLQAVGCAEQARKGGVPLTAMAYHQIIEGDEKYAQAHFSAKRPLANGLAKPTNGLASQSAGLGL
ncbi:hypothetical protein GGX14DRAFT_386324 [Mycena pura]|uniref:Uncharacterized protein n=2 Tax=Mycena pura TaxID=153505 RepID=A0AAD7E2N8_9AGAR|nr:hypothetical protein GGX14DRAFT_386324 [Mycena pura]